VLSLHGALADQAKLDIWHDEHPFRNVVQGTFQMSGGGFAIKLMIVDPNSDQR